MAEFDYLTAGESEAQARQALSYLFTQSSVGLARTGVLSGLSVAQTSTASDSVEIAAGASVVQASVLVGASLLVNNTTKTLDVLTANPMSGLPRNDIVAFDTLTDSIIVIVGTPNAAPTDPTVPATACTLARLRHAASATTIPTANIDDLRVTTELAGIGPWTAYTATLNAGFAVGSTGTALTEYRREGDLIRVRWRFVFGTDGTVTFASGATFTLPVTAHANNTYMVHPGTISRGTTSHVSLARIEAGVIRLTLGTTPLVNVTSTTPWGGAWAPGDYMTGSATYRPA